MSAGEPEAGNADEPKEAPAGSAGALEQAAAKTGEDFSKVEESAAAGKAARRPILESASEAVTYIDDVRKDTRVSVRDFDRRTNLLLGSAIIFLIVPLFCPTVPASWLWVGDAVFGIIILVFLSSRFGLLRTLSPRQAILCWEMIIGSAILGAFLAINAHGLIDLIRGAAR